MLDWSFTEILDLNTILSNRIVQITLSIILIFVQGLLLSRYIIQHRLSRVVSVIPGAIFILFSCTVLEPESFSVILLANLFFILSIGSLFKIYKKYKPVGTIFNSGFYLGIATIFYTHYFIYFIAIIMGLLNLRRLNLKELLQMVSGFLCVYFMTIVFLFYNDNLAILSSHLSIGFNLPNFDFTEPARLIKPILLILTLLTFIFFQNTLRKKKKFDAIKKIELTFWFLFLGLFTFLFVNDYNDSHLMILSAPVSIIGGLIMEAKDKSVLKEVLFMSLIAAYFLLFFYFKS